MKIKVAAIQMSADANNHEGNVIRAKELITKASEAGAKIVVLPELALDEFFAQWKDPKYFNYAEPLDGPTVRTFQKLAQETKTYIGMPLFEKGVMGNYYNSVALISDQGELCGVYRKTHIPFTRSFEKYYFTPGSEFPVFDTPYGKIGIVICYDRKYPESCRQLVNQGAQIILIPISSMAYGVGGPSEVSMWEAELRTRAFENQAFVIAADRSGLEGEYDFIGLSTIVAPTGASFG